MKAEDFIDLKKIESFYKSKTQKENRESLGQYTQTALKNGDYAAILKVNIHKVDKWLNTGGYNLTYVLNTKFDNLEDLMEEIEKNRKKESYIDIINMGINHGVYSKYYSGKGCRLSTFLFFLENFYKEENENVWLRRYYR